MHFFETWNKFYVSYDDPNFNSTKIAPSVEQVEDCQLWAPRELWTWIFQGYYVKLWEISAYSFAGINLHLYCNTTYS